MSEQKVGFLVIHGFAGGLFEIKPLAELLDSKGFDVVCVRLAGHTERRRDLFKSSYKDWIASAEEEFVKLQSRCSKVIVIGFSMGGLVGVNLVAKYDAAALITLCTPIYHWDLKRVGINILHDIKTGEFKYLRHYLWSAMIPVPALINFKIILSKTRKLLNKVTCPMFIAQALKDDTSQRRSAEYIYSHVSSKIKERKYYPDSEHVICLSPEAGALFNDIEKFYSGVINNHKDAEKG